MNRYLPIIGRVLIGLPFVMSGLGKLAAYGPTTAMIAAVGLPVPPLAYLVAVVFELGGGLLLLAGYKVRPVALALAVFCVVAGVAFHSNFADKNQMIHFLKNVMMAGGLLQITAFGAGRSALIADSPEHAEQRLIPYKRNDSSGTSLCLVLPRALRDQTSGRPG